MTYATYLRERLAIYDAILDGWQKAVGEIPAIAADLADLKDYRRVIHDRYDLVRHKEARNKSKTKET